MVWHVITYGVYVGTLQLNKKIQKKWFFFRKISKSQVKNVQSLWIMWIQIIIINGSWIQSSNQNHYPNHKQKSRWFMIFCTGTLATPCTFINNMLKHFVYERAGRLPFMGGATPVLHQFQSWIKKKKEKKMQKKSSYKESSYKKKVLIKIKQIVQTTKVNVCGGEGWVKGSRVRGQCPKGSMPQSKSEYFFQVCQHNVLRPECTYLHTWCLRCLRCFNYYNR